MSEGAVRTGLAPPPIVTGFAAAPPPPAPGPFAQPGRVYPHPRARAHRRYRLNRGAAFVAVAAAAAREVQRRQRRGAPGRRNALDAAVGPGTAGTAWQSHVDQLWQSPVRPSHAGGLGHATSLLGTVKLMKVPQLQSESLGYKLIQPRFMDCQSSLSNPPCPLCRARVHSPI